MVSGRPPARVMELSAMYANPSDWLLSMPWDHTWMRSPSTSPRPSSTTTAAMGNDEKRDRNQRMPAFPTVLPSVDTNRWGRR